MKKSTLIALGLFISLYSYSQNDWELPIHNNKIQFEFNSNKLRTGKQNPCELYTAINTMTDLNTQLRNAMSKGKVKFWTATSFSLFPTLYRADISVGGDMSKYAKPMCGAGNDTLIGSLQINITQVKTMRAGRSGHIKCLYRIIFKDDSYNLKFRGFKYTYYEKGKFGQPPNLVTKPLEEEYNTVGIKKADKEFWGDIKMLVNLYMDTLEKVLTAQGSDLDFDD